MLLNLYKNVILTAAGTVCMRKVTCCAPGVVVAVKPAPAGAGPTLSNWYCPFSVFNKRWPC